MTKSSDKDMPWLAAQIRAAIPEATVEIYKPGPGPKGKGWIIDASGYGTPPGEYYEQADAALARVLYLLRSGKQAKTRREMQLQELRDHRSVS